MEQLASNCPATSFSDAGFPAISFDDYSFSYATDQQRIAVGPVSWQVEEGAFALLVGETGSGKTTLLKALKPELSPHGAVQGTRRVLGQDPGEWTVAQSARTVGYVAQNPDNQVVCSSVWHELAFALENLGTPQHVMRRRVAEVAHFFGIEPWLDKATDQLSGGQKQILALASALALHPKILLLDEPTSQIDPVAEQSFLHALFRVNRQLGITVVVATHKSEAMRDYATSMFELENESCTRTAKAVDEQTARMLAHHPSPAIAQHSGSAIANPDVVITLKDAYVGYPKSKDLVLRGCDLAIEQGSFHAIMGGNGCGKTTLLSAIAGLLKTKRGKVVNNLHGNQALLPQNPKALFVRDSVIEELSEWTDAENARTWLDAANLAHVADHHPYDLSGGQQQLLALAKILSTRPNLLLLDEPTKGLDATSKMQVAGLLLNAKASGATIVMASHDLSFISALADQVSLMFDGGITCTEAPDEFFADNLFYRPPRDAFSLAWERARNAITQDTTAAQVTTAAQGSVHA